MTDIGFRYKNVYGYPKKQSGKLQKGFVFVLTFGHFVEKNHFYSENYIRNYYIWEIFENI